MTYFSMGYWVVGLALFFSAIAAACGLACIRQSAKSETARFRTVWLFVAGNALGSAGVGMPLFITLVGLQVSQSKLHYDEGRVILASVLSGAAAFIALLVAGRTLNWPRLAGAGVIMTAGMAGTHLIFVSGIRIRGSVDQNVLSMTGVIVVAAALSAAMLWLVFAAKKRALLLIGALVYGTLSVTMHLVGMTGLTAQVDPTAGVPGGADLFSYFVPFWVISSLSLAVPVTAILIAPDRREARRLAPTLPQTTPTTSLAAASRAAKSARRTEQPVR
ncbi:hypothetical protein [Nocardia huaxiensis]|uniref:MHYT domain-containing protein n=1 Tax=Nocardia huaxiensis TaxID=2755382 RepID=A0A7D6ZJG4_9NOCA|nr:hypothetical protein [Nocardia huaxiensis]QLY32499.1 hypothetical protein H0264_09725 [Nocardia huaxiensis]UFS93793.1 hypothetical protein LPY97_23720 [Nocardia huaxiensis]